MSKSKNLPALRLKVSFFYCVFEIPNNQPGWRCWVQGSLLWGFQSLLGLSAHSTSLSRNLQTVFGDIWDMFCKHWFWYDWDISDIGYLKRYIWREVNLETFGIYLQTLDWRHFEIFEVFWNESVLWCGIYLIFALYLLVLVFSGKIFVHAII